FTKLEQLKTANREMQATVPGIKAGLLINNMYTDYLQLGYYIEHKCGKSGYCEVSKTDPYREGAGTYKSCPYGCILKVVFAGKEFNNVCVDRVCTAGGLNGGKPMCDYSIGNDVYFKYLTWFCQEMVLIGMICGEGGRCQTRPEGTGCFPITSTSMGNQNQYALVINNISEPIKVVSIQNGQILAEKPISPMSALEYINKYGPVDSSQAYAFAQQTGLTSIVASSNSSTTTGTTRTTYAATDSYVTSSSTSSSNSSWLSKIAAFFGFGKKTTSTTSSATTNMYASTYNSTYTTSTYPSYSSASSTSYSTYSTYPRTYSAYSTTYYTPTYSTAGYSYFTYSTYTNYSYPSSYYYNSSYTSYKPSYTYSSYSSYSYPTYTSTYSSYTVPSYSNYTYSYPNYYYGSHSS
ncbi:MAG: hypothetical protein QXM75_03510, partial [Candidatus Diapherotrites archaeon]